MTQTWQSPGLWATRDFNRREHSRKYITRHYLQGYHNENLRNAGVTDSVLWKKENHHYECFLFTKWVTNWRNTNIAPNFSDWLAGAFKPSVRVWRKSCQLPANLNWNWRLSELPAPSYGKFYWPPHWSSCLLSFEPTRQSFGTSTTRTSKKQSQIRSIKISFHSRHFRMEGTKCHKFGSQLGQSMKSQLHPHSRRKREAAYDVEPRLHRGQLCCRRPRHLQSDLQTWHGEGKKAKRSSTAPASHTTMQWSDLGRRFMFPAKMAPREPHLSM